MIQNHQDSGGRNGTAPPVSPISEIKCNANKTAAGPAIMTKSKAIRLGNRRFVARLDMRTTAARKTVVSTCANDASPIRAKLTRVLGLRIDVDLDARTRATRKRIKPNRFACRPAPILYTAYQGGVANTTRDAILRPEFSIARRPNRYGNMQASAIGRNISTLVADIPAQTKEPATNSYSRS